MKGTAYPELMAQEEKWFVEEDSSRPRVEFKGRTMSVPLSTSSAHRFVRLHEMAHVKWTPRNKSASKEAAKLGCPEVFVQCAEDARMAFLLRKTSNERSWTGRDQSIGREVIYDSLNTGGLSEAQAKAFAKTILEKARVGDRAAIPKVACAMLASKETGDRGRLELALSELAFEAIESEPAHIVENMRYIMEEGNKAAHTAYKRTFGKFRNRGKRMPRFATSIKCAKMLAEIVASLAPSSWAKKGLMLDENGDLVSTGSLHDEKMESSSAPQTYDEPTAKWGSMKIDELKGKRPNKGSVAQKRVASLMGVVPRRIDRWVTDKKIFDIKSRTIGGCVLLDASGSMDIDHREVAELAEASPNMTVAMYSGFDTMGKLTVIAKGGKAAGEQDINKQRHQVGFSNIIDGPALRWLGKQKGPRIWVSDAEVFGSGDKSSPQLRQEVARICKSAAIIRMPSIKTALDVFKMLKKTKGKFTPSVIKFANQVTNRYL